MALSKPVGINLSKVSVDFPVQQLSAHTVGAEGSVDADADRFVEGNGRVFLRALDSIDLQVKVGERLGIWGKNGSGKTTLLRTIRGVYSPTEGEIAVQGRVQSFLNLTFGMNEDASGWENILLRGVLMGSTPGYMRSVSDQIAEFSELGRHLDLPVRGYSAGMRMRLAFSIAMSLPADVILMDEWLSVGDTEFREKAAQRLSAVLEDTRVLVIASHNRKLLERLCTRIIVLEGGRIVSDLSTDNAEKRRVRVKGRSRQLGHNAAKS